MPEVERKIKLWRDEVRGGGEREREREKASLRDTKDGKGESYSDV